MIRSFSLSDLEQILEIEKTSFPKSPYDWATFLNLFYQYPKTFLVYIDTRHGVGGNRILGYIVFTASGHILSIAVDPRHRKKGVGKALIERALHLRRVKKIWAEVRKGNLGAQAFYLKMGFQIIREVPNYYGDEDALIIERAPSEPAP